MAFNPLPGYNVGNALNFQPLQNAVDNYGQVQRQNALMQYQQQRDQVSDRRQNALLGIQQSQEARAQKQFSREQSDAAIKRYAGVLQSIEAYPAEQRSALYQRARQSMLQHDPDFENELKGYGVNGDDYAAVAPFVYGLARGYQAPKAPEVKEVNGRLVAVSSPANGGAPSAQEIYAAPGVGNFKTGKEAADTEESIRKEFTAQSKNFITIRDAYNNVQQLAANPSPAADIGLVYSIMKVFDPTSVVRESEYATAQNAAGVPDQVRNMWNRMLSGERLNDNQRADFVNQAKTIYVTQAQSYGRTRDQYRGITERLGLNPQNTLIEFSNPAQAGPAQSESSSIAGGFPGRQQPTQPGAQGQIPPGAVQLLRSNPAPDVIQQFEQKYGPGSAQQFLGR